MSTRLQHPSYGVLGMIIGNLLTSLMVLLKDVTLAPNSQNHCWSGKGTHVTNSMSSRVSIGALFFITL